MDMHWRLYCSIYPYFSEKTFVSFEDFYKPRKKEEPKHTAKEILAKTESILNRIHFKKENR